MSASSMDPKLFKTLVTCTCVVGVKMLVTNFYAAIPTAQSGFAPPEDSYLWQPLIGVEQKFGVGKDDNDKELSKSRAMVRAQRVVGNDLENIPIGLAILWTAGFAAPPDSAGTVATLAQVFCAARIGHSVVYLAGIQYLRSFVFMAGYGATMGAAVVGLKGVGSLY